MLTSVIFPTEQYSELIYFEEREERLKSFSKNFKMKKKNQAFNLLNTIFEEKL